MYSTTNLPTREAIRTLVGAKVFERLEGVEGAFERAAVLLTKHDREQPEFADRTNFIDRARRSWRKWFPRFNAFVCGCFTEPALSDYTSERMTGLATGMLCEGISLSVLLLGAVSDQATLHQKKKLWAPLLNAAGAVLDGTQGLLTEIERWIGKNNRNPIERCLEIPLREDYEMAKQTLWAMRELIAGWEERPFFDGEEVKRTVTGRSDVTRCYELATNASRFLDEQGAGAISFAASTSTTVDKLLRVGGDVLRSLQACQTKVNQKRKAMDLPVHEDLVETIHEISRHYLANEIPYVPSPWIEGQSAATGRRSHLEMDIERLSKEVGIASNTLRGYVEDRKALQPAAAKTLVDVVRASQRLHCHYRYYVVETQPTGVQNIEHCYRLEVASQDDPAPRGAMDGPALTRLAKWVPKRAGKKAEANPEPEAGKKVRAPRKPTARPKAAPAKGSAGGRKSDKKNTARKK